MITISAPGSSDGIGIIVAAARRAAASYGAVDDVAGLAVRLMADAALERHTLSSESPELTLEAAVEGTELLLTLRDRGEPANGPAARLLSLVELGFLESADSRVDGLGNSAVARLALPTHTAVVDERSIDVLTDDVPLTDRPVTLRALEPGDAAALARCIYRCYGWTYPGTDMYYPDRVAAAIESGRRVGEVAVDDDGEVAAHWGAEFVADAVVETGVTVTDPRFRRRGLANQLGDRLLERLVAMGVRGRLREPVLTHPATQQIALREGAHPVGALLHALPPLQQVGITDGLLPARTSVSVFFSPLAPMPAAVVHVPPAYESFVRRVLAPSAWPIELAAAARAESTDTTTVVRSAFHAGRRNGSIVVEQVGSDLTDAVDAALGMLRNAGAEMVTVQLPASQPALASAGAGLATLGLGFATFLPDLGSYGPALTLQWLVDSDVETSEWVYADDEVAAFVRSIVDQTRAVGDEVTRLRRRHARRQQLFAALPGAADD